MGDAAHALVVLPQVRVDAVVALRCFVDAFSEQEAAALKPLIPALLDEFFKLMNEVRSRVAGGDVAHTFGVRFTAWLQHADLILVSLTVLHGRGREDCMASCCRSQRDDPASEHMSLPKLPPEIAAPCPMPKGGLIVAIIA